jgi:hypothetical protein
MARFNKAKQAAFLAAFAATGSVRQAKDAAGIGSTFSHYEWLEKDPEYRPRFEAAQQSATDVLVAEAFQRAVERKRIYKFTAKGEVCLHPETGEPYYEEKEDNGLLMKMLAAHNPEKYGNKSDVTVSGELTHDATEDLKQILAAARGDESYAKYRREEAARHGNIAGTDGGGGEQRSMENGSPSVGH